MKKIKNQPRAPVVVVVNRCLVVRFDFDNNLSRYNY